MSDKHTTELLIGVLESTVINCKAGLYPGMKWIDEEVVDAIISRLRNADVMEEQLDTRTTDLYKATIRLEKADALLSAAKHLLGDDFAYKLWGLGETRTLDVAPLRKAIADYEGEIT
ncbi:MAG: hypothetical protein IMZ71_02025 [Chloroflexi bacterium]|nr:hypothetical protein [Chloroflexota bacterium]